MLTVADFPLNRYRARLRRAIDGDTFEADLDLGDDVRRTRNIRIIGYNAPELHGPSPDKATEARTALANLLAERPLYLITKKDAQSFARLLATTYVADADGVLIDVADRMKADGFDVPRGQ